MPEFATLSSLLARARDKLPRTPWLPVIAVGAVTGLIAAAVLLWAQGRIATAAPTAEALPRAVKVTTSTAPPPPLVVHVAGAVVQPGLVEVPDGARLADAIGAAGGLLPTADVSRINLAERAVDAGRVYVPLVGEVVPPAMGGGATTGAGTGGGAPSAASPVDLNRADEAELDELPGIGPSTAAAIVAHREANGPFPSVDSLADVRGIGPAKLEALRDLVTV